MKAKRKVEIEYEFVKYDGTNSQEIKELMQKVDSSYDFAPIIEETEEDEELRVLVNDVNNICSPMLNDNIGNYIDVGDHVVINSGIFDAYEEEQYIFSEKEFLEMFEPVEESKYKKCEWKAQFEFIQFDGHNAKECCELWGIHKEEFEIDNKGVQVLYDETEKRRIHKGTYLLTGLAENELAWMDEKDFEELFKIVN